LFKRGSRQAAVLAGIGAVIGAVLANNFIGGSWPPVVVAGGGAMLGAIVGGLLFPRAS
jgi:hypothetical protein